MTKGFVPTNGTPEKVYTDMQKAMLKRIAEFGEDPIDAARNVGYNEPYDAVRRLKKEIIEIAEEMIASSSIAAAKSVRSMIDTKEPITQADVKLRAAQLILDRTNPKTDKVDVTGEVKGGVFILPEKRDD